MSTPNIQSAAVGYKMTANGLFTRLQASSRPSLDIVLRRQDSDLIPETFLPNCSSGTTAVGTSRPALGSTSSTDIADTSGGNGNASENVPSQPSSRPHSASTLSNDSCVTSAVSSSSGSSTSSATASKTQLRHASAVDANAADGDQFGRAVLLDKGSLEYGVGDRDGNDAESGTTSPWRLRPNPRRAAGRTERRYHTADTIRDIERQNEMRDNAIHKRLSLNYGGTAPQTSATTTRLGAAADDVTVTSSGVSRSASSDIHTMSSAFSSDSLRSGRSSSGVSSTASLSRGPAASTGVDISEETADELLTDLVDDAENDVTDDEYETLTARVEIPPPSMDDMDDAREHRTEIVGHGEQSVLSAAKFNKRFGLLSEGARAANGRKFESLSMTSSLPCRHVKSQMASLARSSTEKQRSNDEELANSVFHAS